MPSQQQTELAISQALYARTYVLNALLSGASDAAPEPPEKALFFSADGWHLFLRVERCAFPLKAFLESNGFESALPQPFREILDAEAEWESKRITNAREQLREIAAWALDNDVRPIILKGGLGIIENTPLDLNDLDILLPRDDGGRLFEALVGLGYEPADSAGQGQYTRIQLWRDGALAVEIHHGIYGSALYPADGIWPGASETPECPGLWRLAPLDHVWHVLTHNVEKSPERRGRIRDLLLMRSALKKCSESDLNTLRHRTAGRALAGMLNSTLDLALAKTDKASDDKGLQETILLSYLLANRKENRSRVFPTSGLTNRWVYALLTGPFDRKQIWTIAWVGTPGFSTVAGIRYLQKNVPLLGRIVRVMARLSYYLLLLVKAYLITFRIRLARDKLLHRLKKQNVRRLRTSV